ncbi:phosphate transporter PHO1-like [Papaver somniferum]|uniref:phosphate transporter PHO1-like n=1 Tax=Papaver somniferum TaxID=3469 RepID=UPI000E6F73E1|nr:phosphate transporter PHO1-like [Papaver somniferum]
MVKFSKELEAQLIPEWKDAFVNYCQLKKYVKKVRLSKKPISDQIHLLHLHDQEDDPPQYGFSIFDPVRYVFKKLSAKFQSSSTDQREMIIQVRNKNGEGDEESVYQTELLHLFSEEDEVKEFFERLDEELNKVNQFYKIKEKEFLERGEALNKQLETLLDLKQILSERRRKNHLLRLETGSLARSNSSSVRSASDYSESGTEMDETSPTNEDGKNGVNSFTGGTRTKTKKTRSGLRIDIPATNPTRTISAVTSKLWEDLVNNPKKEGHGDSVNRKKIQCAEKMIRGAFVELYRGLGLLKTYTSLNMVAFVKILKKFDKVANERASSSYLRAVKRSHFISSDKVVRLGDEVESIFTKHFANDDRKKAMKFLRPRENKASHMITFLAGLFTGSFVALFSVYAILAHMSNIFKSGTEPGYLETVYPVFSMFAFLSLHLFMYGCNIFMWSSTRINYSFIFEFSPSTTLKYRDAFLMCASFMSAVVGAMVIHLILRSSHFAPTHVDAIPGVLLLCFIALLICPFNIFYRSTRYCFIRVIRNIAFSPFYKVLMVDFFMADQLCSQIPLLRHMETTACYFLAKSFKTHQYEICNQSKLYRELAYVISFAPYYWRAMQCARRWFDEGDVAHLANLGKYVSAMVAAGARLTFARQHDNLWMFMVVLTSSIATVYQLYWDFVKDWGILNRNSKNRWLRDDLILKSKNIYYISIFINVLLRLVWIESVTRISSPTGFMESQVLDFFLASLEIIRRGHWNYYRLENEHLNNVGKFRAVKSVPLPFRGIDSDD